MTRFKILLFALLFFSLGCTRLFFYPSREIFPALKDENPKYEFLELKSVDGVRLHAMRILTESRPKGVVLQLHGNAQNLTSHFQFVSWLTNDGWEVLTFDYRGYGQSESSIGWFHGDLDGVLGDSISAIDWAEKRASELDAPLVIVGQSLGGALTLRSLLEVKPARLKLTIIDSSFFSFRSIARDVLDTNPATWILTRLVPILVSDKLSPGPRIADSQQSWHNHPLSRPAIFIHSKFDPVVPKRQGDLIHEVYPGPKEQWVLEEEGHIQALTQMPVREKLLNRLAEISAR
jgi:fermentation-respiration switch protein FrsA (DUF1100 family)